jgi:hypothetical protein
MKIKKIFIFEIIFFGCMLMNKSLVADCEIKFTKYTEGKVDKTKVEALFSKFHKSILKKDLKEFSVLIGKYGVSYTSQGAYRSLGFPKEVLIKYFLKYLKLSQKNLEKMLRERQKVFLGIWKTEDLSESALIDCFLELWGEKNSLRNYLNSDYKCDLFVDYIDLSGYHKGVSFYIYKVGEKPGNHFFAFRTDLEVSKILSLSWSKDKAP